MDQISLDELTRLTEGRTGRHDIPCPICGPDRRAQANKIRKVLRVWTKENFASFCCARCGVSGYARAEDQNFNKPNPQKLAAQKAEAERKDAEHALERQHIARFLWNRSQPATGTTVEKYLSTRGIKIPPPSTIRHLPASPPKYPFPALIAAYGFPTEPEPGHLSMAAENIQGVHLIMLKPDGAGKADVEAPKKITGKCLGSPIVLAPPNDGLGLAIAEGVEDALSLHLATGLGAWAAGAAGRMPALANAIPGYIEAVTISADPDPAGRRGAYGLADRLTQRGFDVTITEPGHA